jgi:hypothetical protein
MIEKYRKITIITLLFIPLLIGLFFADSWMLPQKTINDKIISYSRISVNNSNKFSSSEVLVGYIFYTQKGNEFSTQETFIDENEITIKQSYILKNITTVKSQTKDYSDKLMSGLNGACLYFTLGLTTSAIISLLLLWFDKNLSENGFQNIIIFNSFLLFITLYLFVLYN